MQWSVSASDGRAEKLSCVFDLANERNSAVVAPAAATIAINATSTNAAASPPTVTTPGERRG